MARHFLRLNPLFPARMQISAIYYIGVDTKAVQFPDAYNDNVVSLECQIGYLSTSHSRIPHEIKLVLQELLTGTISKDHLNPQSSSPISHSPPCAQWYCGGVQ